MFMVRPEDKWRDPKQYSKTFDAWREIFREPSSKLVRGVLSENMLRCENHTH